MAAENERPQNKPDPEIDSENPPLDSEWFEHAQLTYSGWKVLRINLDWDVLEWYQSRWKNYLNRFNQILEAYLNRKLKVIIPEKEYSSADRVKVVGKYAPELVDWISSEPNSDDFMNLILRDFMQACLEKEQREGKLLAGDNC